jgi:hypothetical protein
MRGRPESPERFTLAEPSSAPFDALAAVTSMVIIVWAALIVRRWRGGNEPSAMTPNHEVHLTHGVTSGHG